MTTPTYMPPPPRGEQPRRGNGQFDVTPRREAPVALSVSDREYNADGTFAYPPIARSYEQIVDFWMRVPVPDQVLYQLRSVYSHAQNDARSQALDGWRARHREPVRYDKHGQRAEWDEWFAALNREDMRLKDATPPLITPVLARPLARAAGLMIQARTLEEQQPGIVERVRQTPIDLAVLGSPSVGSLLDLYPVEELPEETWLDQSSDYGAIAADRLEDIVAIMSGTENEGA